MHPARIAELLDPFVGPGDGQRLTANDLASISTYIDLLLRWNARINLTAVRDPEHIVTRHFGESLFAARHLFPKRDVAQAPDVELMGAPDSSVAPAAKAPETQPTSAAQANREGHGFSRADKASDIERALAPEGNPSREPCLSVADVGSGAGFPGIPIKLWAPHIALTLIESNQKKATFLREVARTLTLTDIDIQTARAETLPRATFDVVTLRAVERFETVLPVAASLVAPGGHLALLIGSAQLPQARTALPDVTWLPELIVPCSESRILAVARRSL